MASTSTANPEPPAAPSGPAEVTEIHTHILRLALGIEESRAYWANVDPTVPLATRPVFAFENRWFGAKSLERVRTLLGNFVLRYDAYPEGLAVLRRWRNMDPNTRQVICHWHLQLCDPIYRRFTGTFLVERRDSSNLPIGRSTVLRWVDGEYPGKWAAATKVQFASKLLSAASEAGLLSMKRDPRTLLFPKVTPLALGYWFYFLRGVRFGGTLVENPYLASVGLVGGILDQALRSLPGITYRHMAGLHDFDFDAPSLAAWAERTLT